jgi:hypoxanthine phosphoribosyltransferase
MEPKQTTPGRVAQTENVFPDSLEISERIKFGWEDVERDCAALSNQITSPNVIIISIGTGGWVPSKLLKSLMVKKGQNVELTTIVVGYSNLHTENESVTLLNDLSQAMVERLKKLISENGYELIIFDTIVNTGRSMQASIDYLKSVGFDGIKVATLHLEEQPKNDVPDWRKFYDIKPDYFAKKVVTHSVNPYIEYPWDNLDK